MHNRYQHRLEPLDFQEKAFNKFKSSDIAAIFFEQGLGKTKIAIDLMLHWLQNGDLDKMFIVVKKGLVNNWYSEIKKHTFMIPAILSNTKSKNTSIFMSRVNVLVLNYEIILNEFERIYDLGKIRNLGIILDESAKIKNPEANISKKLHQISDRFKKKVIMTGTPSANRPEDYWSQIFFLDRGKSLGEKHKVFFEKVKISNDLVDDPQYQNKLIKNIEDIKEKIAGFTLRETKDSSSIELPEKIFENIFIEFSSEQGKIYTKALTELRTKIEKENISFEDNVEAFLKRIIRIRQICSNPKMLDLSFNEKTNRLQKTLELVRSIAEKNEKCIIWTSFKYNINYLKVFLEKFNPVALDGSMQNDERKLSVTRFLEQEDTKVLIATPQSSKEGLTLTVANHCIYFDRTLSLDDYLQSQDRIHRIGQTKNCFYYNLIIKNSVDEWVESLIDAKSLFAKLSIGDISNVEFSEKIKFNFGELIKKVLEVS